MMGYALLVQAEDRMREALRQAEEERLLRLAEAARRRRPRSARLLAGLGDRLAAWGEALQRRFGDSPEPAPFVPIQDWG
jgi:hypothetical protein